MNSTHSEPSATAKKYYTTRFGEVEVHDAEIIVFPEGILGFNSIHRYILIKDPDQDPFLWLQALDDPDLAFVIVNPFIFFPGYEIQVKSHELAPIMITEVAKATILTIVTIPTDPMDITSNLRGPLVFNMEQNLAKQLVLIDDRYHTKHFLLKDIPPYLATPPGRHTAEKTGVNATSETQTPEP